MSISPLCSRIGRVCLLVFASCGAAYASAVPLTDLRAEDLPSMADAVEEALGLTANQQLLWRQVEAKTRTILRERIRRREALQERAKQLLAQPNTELRDLHREVEAEAAAALAEERQLRGLWLEVNDALDDTQRRQVAGFLSEQMMRVAAPAVRAAGEQGRHGGPGGGRGAGAGRGAMGRQGGLP